MASTYYQIYIHAVFAVKYRSSLLEKDWRGSVHNVIANLINETGCKAIIVNGVEDHVHCLLGLKPTISISELMKRVKAKSSKHINESGLTPVRFEWQDGYGAFSYSQSSVKSVYRYIADQENHHKKKTLAEEHQEFLEKFKVKYDPRNIFHLPK